MPHWFHAADGAGDVLALAGLWERWTDPASGEEVRTCSIATCAPNAKAAHVHDRMPVVLDEEGLARWLAPESTPAALHTLLRARPDQRIDVWAVGRGVGNVRAQGEELIARAA